MWLLLFHRARATLQELVCSWPQGNNMRRKDTWGNGDEWSVIIKLYSLSFSSYSLLQRHWETAQAAAANTGCDQCVSQGKAVPLRKLRRAGLGALPSSATGALTALVSWHWGFGQWYSQKLWKASWNDKIHCHFNAFTNPELEGTEDYTKLN